jgi:hypothetical protein
MAARPGWQIDHADGQLNLPVEQHPHRLLRLAALQAARGSLDNAADAIWRASGMPLGKRQVQQLAACATVDVDGFYTGRCMSRTRPSRLTCAASTTSLRRRRGRGRHPRPRT